MEQRHRGRGEPRAAWDDARLRALRRHLGLTQQALAGELGVRQQTVSEWETGAYRPRGASARLLGIVAEQTGFQYEPGSASVEEGPDAEEPNANETTS